jgi:hypothetical protein
MSLAHNPLLAGLSSLHLAVRREDLHAAALDALGQTLAFVDDTPQGPMLAPHLGDLVRHHLASPTPPPAPPISGFATIGHPAARRIGAEALRDSVLLALQTGQADLGQSVVALVGLARATVPDATAATMIGEIEAVRRRYARGSAADDASLQPRLH